MPPITYEPAFDDSPFDLVARISGEVTLEGLLESRRQLLDDPRLRAGISALFDYTGADVHRLSVEDIRTAAGEAQSERQGLRAVAVVAPDDLTFGFARMFQSFAEVEGGAGSRVVVRSVAEAEAWLRALDADGGAVTH